MKKISIIIPVYNTQEAMLVKCLNSCLNQTYLNTEIIIVNDGSTNNIDAVIDSFYELYPEAIVKFKINNSGASLARKYGVDNCTGDFVFFLDADDFLNKNALSLLATSQSQNNSDVVVGQFYLSNSTGNKEMGNYHLLDGELSIIKSFLMHKLPQTLWPNLYKKTLLERVYFYNYVVGEDMVINSQIFTIKDLKLSVIKDFIYYYVRHETSLTRQSNTYKTEEGYNAYNKSIEIIINNIDEKSIEVELSFNMFNTLYALVVLNSSSTKELIAKLKCFDKVIINKALSLFNKKKKYMFLLLLSVPFSDIVVKRAVKILRGIF